MDTGRTNRMTKDTFGFSKPFHYGAVWPPLTGHSLQANMWTFIRFGFMNILGWIMNFQLFPKQTEFRNAQKQQLKYWNFERWLLKHGSFHIPACHWMRLLMGSKVLRKQPFLDQGILWLYGKSHTKYITSCCCHQGSGYVVCFPS